MMLPDPPPPTLKLRIDAEALAANWRALDTLSAGARAGAAVKANAYGLGVDEVVPVLAGAGARDFFVAHWSEVPPLLDYVAAERIAVLHGVSNPAEAAFARRLGVRPVLNSTHQAGIWLEAGGGPCHLMVDTGINRLGLPMAELGADPIARLEVEILLSHLASADEDVAQNARQLERFSEAVALRPAREYSFANSAGIALGADYAFDLTRPGLALYGGIPRAELSGMIRQVAFPEAAILQLRDLEAGDPVGYNATFVADRAMRVATVSLGYADGYLRCRGPGTALRLHGHDLPVIGRVSMDMVVVDCSTCPEAGEGDFLEVPFDLPDVARTSGLSQYELLTSIGDRFGR